MSEPAASSVKGESSSFNPGTVRLLFLVRLLMELLGKQQRVEVVVVTTMLKMDMEQVMVVLV